MSQEGPSDPPALLFLFHKAEQKHLLKLLSAITKDFVFSKCWIVVAISDALTSKETSLGSAATKLRPKKKGGKQWQPSKYTCNCS